MPKGTLLVKPQSAKLLKDSDFISKMVRMLLFFNLKFFLKNRKILFSFNNQPFFQHSKSKTYPNNILYFQDPFVLVKVGDQSKKSLVAKKGGLNPTWSDVLTFYINEEKDINFMIYDHDSLTKDDYLGKKYFFYNFSISFMRILNYL